MVDATNASVTNCTLVHAALTNGSACVEDLLPDNDVLTFGVALVELAAFQYALGLCVQKYALANQELGKRPCGCNHNLVWVLGLCIYASSNLWYTVALAYMPLSLAMALFSCCLIYNAGLARCILGERLSPTDWVSLLLILGGIVLCSMYMPHESTIYSADDIVALLRSLESMIFLGAVAMMLLILIPVIYCLERRERLEDSGFRWHSRGGCSFALGMIMYPAVLATFEAMFTLCLKGLSSMLFLTFVQPEEEGGANQLGHWLFYVFVGTCFVASFFVMVWLRKSYSRFETGEILPLEFGVMTTLVVGGGLTVYDEQRFIDRDSGIMIIIGLGLLWSGLLLMSVGKTLSKKLSATCGPISRSHGDSGMGTQVVQGNTKGDEPASSDSTQASGLRSFFLGTSSRAFMQHESPDTILKVLSLRQSQSVRPRTMGRRSTVQSGDERTLMDGSRDSRSASVELPSRKASPRGGESVDVTDGPYI